MIDLGIVMLVNAGLGSPPFVGGFDSELPKDAALPNYTYTIVFDHPDTGLEFFKGLSKLSFQIDCYGNSANDALTLSRSIDLILNGFQGVLPDPDATRVSSVMGTDRRNFFDDSRRTFRRMLEYEIWYFQN
jgi:hypothetical protein